MKRSIFNDGINAVVGLPRLMAFCLLLLCWAMTPGSMSAGTVFEYEGLFYETTGPNTVKVGDNNNISGDVVIPETVVHDQKNYTVTAIGSSAFYCERQIVSVTIPESVLSIGGTAFGRCSGLTSVTIPNSVTSIGYSAFDGCQNLQSVTLPDSLDVLEPYIFRSCVSLEHIELPESLKSIGKGAFADCTGLTSFAWPASITVIQGETFRGCTGLRGMAFPESVTEIGYDAFSGCTGLTSVALPASIAVIKDKAFSGCSSLEEISFPDRDIDFGANAFQGTLWYDKQPDGLVYIGRCAYHFKGELPQGASVTITDGTTAIAGCCFMGCTWLSGVELPGSIARVGASAFADCSSLTTVDLPDGAELEQGVFARCTSLSTVRLPQGLVTLPEKMFKDCSSLASITVPPTVTTIGSEAFSGCSQLKDASLPPSIQIISSSVFYDCISLEHVTMPRSAVQLGYWLFNGCRSLKQCVLPAGITGLGEGMFSGCSSLTTVGLPLTLQRIGNYAFSGCSSLADIQLPAAMQQLGYGVFQDCTGLRQITSLAMAPPSAHEDEEGYEGQFAVVYPGTFSGIDMSKCTLTVFKSAKADYRAAKGWRKFTHYETVNENEHLPGDVNGDGVVDIADVNGIINNLLGDASIDVNGVMFGLAMVQGGTFEMGAEIPQDDLEMGLYDSVPSPKHQVTLDSYFISTTEVTRQLWHAVMGGSEPEYDMMNRPIYDINWNAAQTFIERLNQLTGLQFRLPTEAEWEFAARGGNKSQGYLYSGSNDPNEVGWCSCNPWGPEERKKPRPVGSLQPNELGIYDMSGNVWEWCQDWFADYTDEPQVNPTGPETGTRRVIRGGSCYNELDDTHCSVYNRAAVEPTKTVYGSFDQPIGIRLAMDYSPELYTQACDVTGDGRVDIADVNAVINIMLGHADYDVPTGNPGHDTDPGR